MVKCFNNYAKLIPSLLFIILIIVIFAFSFTIQNKIYKPDSIIDLAKNTKSYSSSGQIDSDMTPSKSFGTKNCSFSIKTKQGFYLYAEGQDNWCYLKYHEEIVFTGKLANYDYKTSSSSPSAKYAAKINISYFKITKLSNGIDYITNSIRSSFIEVTSNLPKTAQALVPAMAIGYTNNFDSDLSDIFKVSGLTHLVAISGAHFVIIISLIGAILLSLNVKKEVLAIIEIISILAFAALVHPTPSVLRASFMGIIGLIGLILHRRAFSLSALSFTIIVLLIVDPYLTTSYGFAMSCSATAGIILLAPYLAQILSKLINQTLAEIISVTLSAQFFCGPIIVLIYPFFTPYSLIANFLVTPFVAPATVLGVAAALLSPALPALAYIISYLSGIFCYPIYLVAKIINYLPFSKISFFEDLPGLIILIFFNLIIVLIISGKIWDLFYIYFKKVLPPKIESKLSLIKMDISEKINQYKLFFLRRKILNFSLTALIFLPLIIASSISIPKFFTIQIDQNWKMAACNVGQGDSSVIKTGQFSAIVIDTGPDETKENQCLKDLDIKTIDLLILTHFHDDHIGGLSGAINGRKVSQALISNSHTPKKEAEIVLSKLTKQSIPYKNAEENSEENFQGVRCYTFQALTSNNNSINTNISNNAKQTNSKSSYNEDSFSNDSSIGTIIFSNNLKMIFLGDMEKNAQTQALKKLKQLGLSNFDILKVAHHGSKTQNEELAKLIHPKIAIFEVGKGNSYGHPNEKTLNLFSSLNSKILRTDQDGLLGVSVNDKNIIYTFSQNI